MLGEPAVSARTLGRILEACERLLDDDDWFADRPYLWRLEVERLRDDLAAQLDDQILDSGF